MAAMTAAGQRTGVLVVRAWVEGDPPQLKARITHTLDVTRPQSESATASSADQICAEVRRWLDALERRGDPVTGP
jgi:hypothetical protein